MAIFSGYNKHPDEYLHCAAVQYYYDHWLPPKVGDLTTLNSYSKYGFSYLNNLEVVYFFIGKISNTIHKILINQYFIDRLFNVLLYILLIYYCAYKYTSRIIFIIFFMSPQIWYIFSYVNGDALPFFISFIIVSELITKDSYYKKYLESPDAIKYRWVIIYLGILFGFLILSKSNYMVLIFYFIFIFAWNIINSPAIIKRKLLINNIFIISIAISIFSLTYVYDVAINGLSKYDKVFYYAEKLADPQFKPSASNSKDSYYGLYLKNKGVTYTELYSLWNWHKISFMSFVGTYGWMNIYASPVYYNLMGCTYLFFILFIFLTILYRSTVRDNIFMIITIFFMCSVLVVSSLFSWVIDFQAQGRYLFPILIMLCPIVYVNRDILNKKILTVFVIVYFMLSCYSFMFIGLNGLANP
jgi:hypothetical protein